jgi:hypothetical protein
MSAEKAPAQIRQRDRKDPSIQPSRFRKNRTAWQQTEFLPELTLICGRDEISSGIHATALLPSGGLYPSPVTLLDVRWDAPILSLEELVLVTIRGLEKYARDAGYDLPPR